MDIQIRFTDSIPKSASGKILKKKLREDLTSDSGYESLGESLGEESNVCKQDVRMSVLFEDVCVVQQN